jgi:hypothetical protein
VDYLSLASCREELQGQLREFPVHLDIMEYIKIALERDGRSKRMYDRTDTGDALSKSQYPSRFSFAKKAEAEEMLKDVKDGGNRWVNIP